MSCNVTIPPIKLENGNLNVSEKYIQLMRDSVSEDSLYLRAKDTFKVMFDDLQLNEKEKAKVLTEYISGMTVELSKVAMQTAVQWSKEERDGGYALAKAKAETELVQMQTLKAKEEICLAEKQAELACANITATISASFRENGKPTGYEANGCKPTGLEDKGLKYHQTRQVEAATYQVQADAYRKSGVVNVGIDSADGIKKGLSGDDDGYTNQQSKNAERQRIAYEDSKRNHAANSASTMIGQLLSSETLSTSNAQDVELWRESVRYLNKSHSSTSGI